MGGSTMYVAHTSDDGREQALREHLENVGQCAARYAAEFGASAHAYRAGILHDIGKYSLAGQHRMRDPEHTPKVDHSTAGAITAKRLNDLFSAMAIAGHHGGLMNLGSRLSSESDGTLMSRLRKVLDGDLDCAAWQTEVQVPDENVFPSWLNPRDCFSIPFYTRMLFSCLVDADYIDTETFMRGWPALRDAGEAIESLWQKLQMHIKPWLEAPPQGINGSRSEILRDCIAAGTHTRGLFTLTVPTGGGKTVSSLAFALSHAVKNQLRRVIYVIPYTSIIEQNAKVFSDILGPENVLEHHAGVNFEDDVDGENPQRRRKMLATENWNAPVVVTTAVQFFESLFSRNTSKCRKLHNIANSVIIFDEAQMLPLPYLEPCVAAIAELIKNYRATAVLCTATQPSLSELFHRYAPGAGILEICRHTDQFTALFRRVNYRMEGTLSLDRLAEQLTNQPQTLCVANRRKTVRELFQRLPAEGRFHLSTHMTPVHRSRVLEEIRRRLRSGKVCRVISTSLIEAGVDVDFPALWRERAGLDSIIQTAGRCNREGKRAPEDSFVHIFSLEESVPGFMQQNVAAAELTIERQTGVDTAPAIKCYFDTLLRLRNSRVDDKNIMDMCSAMDLRTVAENFHLIDEDTVPIYIPSSENADDLARLRRGEISRGLLRRLGRSAVSVYRREWRALWEAGKLEQRTDEFSILSDLAAYDEEWGLNVEAEQGRTIWI